MDPDDSDATIPDGGLDDSAMPEPAFRIIATTPAVASTGNQTLAIDGVVAEFSEAVACSTVTDASFSLSDLGVAVPGHVTCEGATLTFHPSARLPTRTTLRATLAAGLASTAGNTLATAVAWEFEMAAWTRQIDGPNHDWTDAIATDGTSLYVAGTLLGAADADLFLLKYSATGVEQWRHVLVSAPSPDHGNAVAVSPSGALLIAGMTYGGLDGNPSGNGSENGFVAKYDLQGNKQWVRQITTNANDGGWGVAGDANGNVYATGYTNGSPNGTTNAGGTDVFVVKYDAAGELQWTRLIGTTSHESTRGIAIDSTGAIYVSGSTLGALGGNTSAGYKDGFLAKLDGSGTVQWIRQFGSMLEDSATAVTIDANDRVYVAGHTAGAVTSSPSAGGWDRFVLKYTTAGMLEWAQQIGTPNTETTNSVVTDGAGNIYVSGDAYGPIGGIDGYHTLVTKLDANGTEQWSQQLELAAFGYGMTSLGMDVFVVGRTSYGLDGNTQGGATDGFVVKFDHDGRRR